MKVLITAATNMELSEIEKKTLGHSYLDLLYAVTGVGMVATTYHLMDKLQKHQIDLMIQIGIAGCFDQQLSLGNAVTIRSESIAEMGVLENNEYKDIFNLQLADANQFPYQNGALVNPHNELLLSTGLPNFSAVTVNQITTEENVINRYKTKYGAALESMEGAAFHYVALMQQIPFVQIRGISNYVGERNKKNWKIFEAMQSSTEACLNLLHQLKVK